MAIMGLCYMEVRGLGEDRVHTAPCSMEVFWYLVAIGPPPVGLQDAVRLCRLSLVLPAT